MIAAGFVEISVTIGNVMYSAYRVRHIGTKGESKQKNI